MKLLKPTPIKNNISHTAGYSTNSSIVLVHAKPTKQFDEQLHRHAKDSEYFYVLHGSLTLEVDGQIIKVVKGMCLETEPMENHKIISFVKNTEYIVIRTNILPGQKELIG